MRRLQVIAGTSFGLTQLEALGEHKLGAVAEWGTALQTSSLELPDADAHPLLGAVEAAEAVPEFPLAVAESPEDYGTEGKGSV